MNQVQILYRRGYKNHMFLSLCVWKNNLYDIDFQQTSPDADDDRRIPLLYSKPYITAFQNKPAKIIYCNLVFF
jgi:hypothetical protein